MAGEVIPDEVFIIRLWAEPRAAGFARHWRGRVRVLNSGKEIYADSADEVVRTIRSVLRKAGMKAR